MTQEEFKGLREGDIIQSLASRNWYIVSAISGTHVTAVMTVEVTKPSEFDIVSKAQHKV